MDIVSLIQASLAQKAATALDVAKIQSQPGLINATAGANLDNVKAGLLPNESAASIAEQAARTQGQLATNQTIGPLAQSQIGLQRQQARSAGALGGYYDTEAAGNNITNQGSSFADYLQRYRVSRGLSPGGL